MGRRICPSPFHPRFSFVRRSAGMTEPGRPIQSSQRAVRCPRPRSPDAGIPRSRKFAAMLNRRRRAISPPLKQAIGPWHRQSDKKLADQTLLSFPPSGRCMFSPGGRRTMRPARNARAISPIAYERRAKESRLRTKSVRQTSFSAIWRSHGFLHLNSLTGITKDAERR